MNRFRCTALGIGITLALAGAQSGATQATAAPPKDGVAFPQPGSADPIANEGVIEDGAIDALKEMSDFLMSAKTLGITSTGSLDVVTNNGQRIQLDGTTTYKVRRPGFVADDREEIFGRYIQHIVRRWQDDQIIDARGFEDPALERRRREPRRRDAGAKDRQRMWFERDDDQARTGRFRAQLACEFEDAQVPAVNAVEIADREHGSPEFPLEPGDAAKDLQAMSSSARLAECGFSRTTSSPASTACS